MLTPLFILLSFSVILTCALTPWVYLIIITNFPNFDHPYSRVFDRVILAVLLIALYLTRKRFAIVSGLKQAFLKNPAWKRHVFYGASLTLIVSAIFFPLCVGPNHYLIWGQRGLWSVFGKMLVVLVSAIVIAVLEEFVFRGVIYRELRRACLDSNPGTPVTEKKPLFILLILSASLLYALVHFINPIKTFSAEPFSAWSGFTYLGVIFERIIRWETLPAILALTSVGVILTYAYEKTSSLYLSIGLHAGWILAIKLFGLLTVDNPIFDIPEAIGRRYAVLLDPITFVSIALCALVVVLSLRKQQLHKLA